MSAFQATTWRHSLNIIAVSITLAHFTLFAGDLPSESEWSPGSLNYMHTQTVLQNQGFSQLGVNLNLSIIPMEGLLTLEVVNKWTKDSFAKYELVTIVIQYPLDYAYLSEGRCSLLRKIGVTVYRTSIERPVAFVVLRRSDSATGPANGDSTKVVIAEFRSQVDKNGDGKGDLSSCWVELPEVSEKSR